VKIELLNHAAVIISLDEGRVRLLCDPWLFGTCFRAGWGLKYENLAALDKTRACTHLWVSHFHSDHFHVPTLKKILSINPDIRVLGNRSYNFKMDDVMRKLGFANVLSFGEREPVALSEQVRATRFPTTGIDNMLFVETPDINILNYNDCNIPVQARQKIAEHIGSVDVMLNNYNHAGKILDYPLPESKEIKAQFGENFVCSMKSFDPKVVIPFASHHYYRCRESMCQNDSLLSIDEVAALADGVVALEVGQTITIEQNMEHNVERTSEVQELDFDIREQQCRYTAEALSIAAMAYTRRVNGRFAFMLLPLPELRIRVVDLNTTFTLTFRRGLQVIDQVEEFHISASSEALYNWFAKPYGTDDFIVGGHFSLHDSVAFPMQWQFLLGLLTENRLDLLSILKMVVFPSGLRFLFNRREEISAVMRNLTFSVGPRK